MREKEAVVLIGGSRSQYPYAELIKAKGYALVVVDRDSRAPACELADHFYCCSIYESDEIVAYVKKLATEVTILGALTSSSQFAAICSANAINALLENPTIPMRALENVQSKILLKRAFKRAKVTSPEFIVFEESLDDAALQQFMRGRKSVIKPSMNSGGSAGVKPIQGEQDIQWLADHYDTEYKGHGAVLEAFVEGREFSIDGIIYAGKVDIFCVCEKISWHIAERTLPAGYIALSLASLTKLESTINEKITDISHSALSAMALDNALFSIDILVADDAYNVIEAGIMLDAKIDRLLHAAGVPIYQHHLDLALGQFTLPGAPTNAGTANMAGTAYNGITNNAHLIFLYGSEGTEILHSMADNILRDRPSAELEWNVNEGVKLKSAQSLADIAAWYIAIDEGDSMDGNRLLTEKKVLEKQLKMVA